MTLNEAVNEATRQGSELYGKNQLIEYIIITIGYTSDQDMYTATARAIDRQIYMAVNFIIVVNINEALNDLG